MNYRALHVASHTPLRKLDKWQSPALISRQPAWSMNCTAVPRPLPIVSKEWGPFCQCAEGHRTLPTVLFRLALDPWQSHWTVPCCSVPKSFIPLDFTWYCASKPGPLAEGTKIPLECHTLMSENSDPSLPGRTAPPWTEFRGEVAVAHSAGLQPHLMHVCTGIRSFTKACSPHLPAAQL